jgi:hypothetical protein
MTIYIELTQFAKSNGPLTKTIRLNGDGSVHSDSSACLMAGGTAQRLKLAAIGELAATIERMKPNEALSLGRMRPDLPDQVKITTKAQQRLNGAAQPDVIVRTADNPHVRLRCPGFSVDRPRREGHASQGRRAHRGAGRL